MSKGEVTREEILVRKAGILGGALVIRNSRVPITRILALLSKGLALGEIRKTHYPHIPIQDMKDAVHEVSCLIESRKVSRAWARRVVREIVRLFDVEEDTDHYFVTLEKAGKLFGQLLTESGVEVEQ